MSWLFADKILRMIFGLFIGVWLTRYLGPTAFGQWSYYSAYLYFFSILATMGLETITTNMLVEIPEDRNKILTSAFTLRASTGLFSIILSFSIAYLFDIFKSREELVFVLIMSLTFIIQPFEVLFSYFQAIFKPKYTAYANLIAFLISSLMKVILMSLGFGLSYFIYNGVGEIFLSMIILIIIFLTVEKRFTIDFDKVIFYSLLRKSMPLLFAGFIISIYMRIDQFMIGKMLGDTEVGIYSAAVKIAEIWNFIPSILISVLFPKILEARRSNSPDYQNYSDNAYKIFSVSGLASSLFTMFSASIIIKLLYGETYAQADEILFIYGGSIVFVFIGTLNNSFLIADGLSKYIIYQTTIASVINIILNYFLIIHIGIKGAAISTFIAYCFAAFLGNLVFKRTRPYFWNQIHSITHLYGNKRNTEI